MLSQLPCNNYQVSSPAAYCQFSIPKPYYQFNSPATYYQVISQVAYYLVSIRATFYQVSSPASYYQLNSLATYYQVIPMLYIFKHASGSMTTLWLLTGDVSCSIYISTQLSPMQSALHQSHRTGGLMILCLFSRPDGQQADTA